MSIYCPLPFNQMIINETGNVTTCNGKMNCKILGNIFTQDNIDDIWNSQEAIELRKSIHENTFEFCDKSICPMPLRQVEDEYLESIAKQGYRLDGPKWLRLANDKSCVLRCRICRDNLYIMPKERQQEFIDVQNKLFTDEFIAGLKQVHLATAGDYFSSKPLQSFASRLSQQKFPNLKITLLTHGLGFRDSNKHLFENFLYALDWICLSVDAATKETYEYIRRNSNFERLISSLTYLKEIKKRHHFKVRLNFVVQAANYKEIPDFVRLCKEFNFDMVYFQKLINFNLGANFKKMAIHLPDHPQHEDFLNVLRLKETKDPIVNWSNLRDLHHQANHGAVRATYTLSHGNKWCRIPISHLDVRPLRLHLNERDQPQPVIQCAHMDLSKYSRLEGTLRLLEARGSKPVGVVLSILEDGVLAESRVFELVKKTYNFAVDCSKYNQVDINIGLRYINNIKKFQKSLVEIEPFRFSV